jgi:hypothetical protein
VTSVSSPSLEKRSLSPTFKDGQLDVIIGRKGKGKTSFALDLLPKRPHVIICPGATNPDILAYDFRYNDDAGLKRALQVKNRVVFCYQVNNNLFSYLEEPNLVLLLDDIRMIINTRELKRAFIGWVKGVRWRHQRVIITTHRPLADMPPDGYDMANNIFWVGPLKDPEEAELVWEKAESLDCEKAEFLATLKTLSPYDYKTQNVKNSVIQIKSD